MTDDVRIPALVHSLQAFVPTTIRAEHAREGMLELLQTSEHPFSREHDSHHFTASAIVVSHRGYLLHRHKLSGDWLQPGGHIDGAEWPSETAVRETAEETGVSVDHPASGPVLLNVDVHVTVNGHTHYDLAYLTVSSGQDPAPPEGESPDVGWFDLDEAVTLTDDVCRQLIVAASTHSTR